MKEIDELNQRMDGNDEIVDSLIKKIDELEKREVKSTDYTLHFEALKKIFEVFFVRYNEESAELKAAIGRLDITNPAEQIQGALAEVKPILEMIIKSLPVKVKHQLDINTRGFTIAGMILLIVTAICIGLCGHLWTANNHLQAIDIKYRLIRQIDSVGTKWADSIYTSNPDKAESTLTKLENGVIKLSMTKKSTKISRALHSKIKNHARTP